MQSTTKKKPSNRQSKAPSPDGYDVVVWWSEEDGCHLAEAPALPGTTTHGKSPEEALGNARVAIELWLEVAAKHGDHIPPPRKHLSGKMLLRLPSSLHEKITRQAELEGVSVNQWAMTVLAEAHGERAHK